MPPVSLCLNAGGMGRIDAESETLLPINGGVFDVAHTLRGAGHDASEDGTGRGVPLIAFSGIDSGNDAANDVTPTLRKGGDGGQGMAMSVAFETAPSFAFDLNQITSKTNRSKPDPAVHHTLPATSCPPHLAQGWTVRRLTPVECERLQAFPDQFTRIPYRGKPAEQCPDGPRYKALGNSMAVNVMQLIGERIAIVENAQ